MYIITDIMIINPGANINFHNKKLISAPWLEASDLLSAKDYVPLIFFFHNKKLISARLVASDLHYQPKITFHLSFFRGVFIFFQYCIPKIKKRLKKNCDDFSWLRIFFNFQFFFIFFSGPPCVITFLNNLTW